MVEKQPVSKWLLKSGKIISGIILVSNPELVSVTQYDVMFLLVPFLETHSDKGKVSLADMEMPAVLLNIINR